MSFWDDAILLQFVCATAQSLFMEITAFMVHWKVTKSLCTFKYIILDTANPMTPTLNFFFFFLIQCKTYKNPDAEFTNITMNDVLKSLSWQEDVCLLRILLA